jgi:site-specific DNA recombinase
MKSPQSQPATVRVATYARYSSDKQRESSIEDQQRNCQRLIEGNERDGWTLVAEFADKAISGSDNERPQYLAMMDAAKRGEFDVLVIDNLARLSRSLAESETVAEMLKFRRIRVVTATDGYDSARRGSKMHRQFKGVMNEQFLDDLREAVIRGQTGQALKARWNGGRPYGYRLVPIADASQHDAYGNPAKVGTMLAVEPAQAKIVREIFTRYASGDSAKTIADDLNTRGVASAGSTWKRKVRICEGWRASSVRSILINPLHRGLQRWNVSQFEKNPDAGKYLRRKRESKEHVTNQLEALRIVSDELFAAAQARMSSLKDTDPRKKTGGKVRYMLSGLLRCESCGAHYVIADKYSYACSSFIGGGRAACSNGVRVNRVSLEDQIIGPIREDLRDPVRVKRMAAELQREFAAATQARVARAASVPAAIVALDERIAKLRAMADLTDDERSTLVAAAEAKRRELQAAQPAAKQEAQILSMLPRAAALYLKQLERGLAGDPREAARGRAMLGAMTGPISLSPGADGSLWASYRLNHAALVRTASFHGRGDRI